MFVGLILGTLVVGAIGALTGLKGPGYLVPMVLIPAGCYWLVWKDRIGVFERGVVHGGSELAFTEVVEFYYTCLPDRVGLRGKAGLILQLYHSMFSNNRLTLKGNDGREVVLTATSFGPWVQSAVVDAVTVQMLPAALAAWDAGETMRFGQLSISRDKLRLEGPMGEFEGDPKNICGWALEGPRLLLHGLSVPRVSMFGDGGLGMNSTPNMHLLVRLLEERVPACKTLR